MKIKIYGNKINTNAKKKKKNRKNSCKCLSLIMLDSVIKVNKKYYLKTLLEECKYEMKKAKMENFINDDLESSSSDNETESDSDNESDNEPKSDTEPKFNNLLKVKILF